MATASRAPARRVADHRAASADFSDGNTLQSAITGLLQPNSTIAVMGKLPRNNFLRGSFRKRLRNREVHFLHTAPGKASTQVPSLLLCRFGLRLFAF
jgi:hypothetical protein